MRLPSVSVIIPLFNYKEYVCDAVCSCLDQKYNGQLEVIVVDDGSTDRSVDVIKKTFGGRPLKIIEHVVNKGYSVAKNTGIRASSGDCIVLLDADDMLTPDSIKVRAEYMMYHPEIDMVHGRAYIIHDEGGYDYYCKRMYKLGTNTKQKIHAQTTMLRRSVHLKYGLYDERLRSRSDNEMWNRLNLYAIYPGGPKIKIGFIEEPPVAFYRKHSKSMIEYRRKNPLYNSDVTRMLEEAKAMRQKEGINRSNTPWLKR